MLTSLPVNLLNEYHIGATKAIAVSEYSLFLFRHLEYDLTFLSPGTEDKALLDGLTKAGFKLNHYPGGLFIKYFRYVIFSELSM